MAQGIFFLNDTFNTTIWVAGEVDGENKGTLVLSYLGGCVAESQ